MSSSSSASSFSLLLSALLFLVLSSLSVVRVSGASASTCNSTAVWIEEGPYFVDGQLQRSYVASGYAGIAVNYTLVILDGRNTTTNQCTPLANVKVDTWECDWDGLYSDESVEGTLGNEYLRGYQLSNASGAVQFQSLYPGWYSGRTTHIHFRLRVYDGAGGGLSYDETTQFFFDDTITSYIYANIAPYSTHTGRDTYNTGDRIYTTDNQLSLQGSYTAGYTTTVYLTIPLGGTASNYILGNASIAGGGGTTSNTSSGGGTNTGAGGGGGGGGGGGSAPGGGSAGGMGGRGVSSSSTVVNPFTAATASARSPSSSAAAIAATSANVVIASTASLSPSASIATTAGGVGASSAATVGVNSAVLLLLLVLAATLAL